MNKSIYLASASPRRAKILKENFVDFEIITTAANEISLPNEPEETVLRNAIEKGKAARAHLIKEKKELRPVLSADTIVWCNNKIYGKPRDLNEARKFLRELSGRTHYVFTGVALDDEACVQTSAVTFREFTDEEIDEYVTRVKPLDRAGSYDIDCGGERLIKKFSGSYENIMGLPLEPLASWEITKPKFRDERPVGFFDSGYGGLCVLNEFKKFCPNESTIYIADSASCPYGSRSAEEIIELSKKNVKRLIEGFNCKLIVVACNTASAAAIETLRKENSDIMFVAMEPAIKIASLKSKTGIVGVLATEGTLNGKLYQTTKSKCSTRVIAGVADDWVAFVEKNARFTCRDFSETINIKGAEKIVRARIEPLLDAHCDVLVLGCTHFPHLKNCIEKIAGERAVVIDSSNAVARRAADLLSKNKLSAKSDAIATHTFLTTKVR